MLLFFISIISQFLIISKYIIALSEFEELAKIHCPTSISNYLFNTSVSTVGLFWEGLDRGECFQTLPIYNITTLSKCNKRVTGNEYTKFVRYNNSVHAIFKSKHDVKCCLDYNYKETINLLNNKNILFIGDSRIRYQFVTFLYWLEYQTWPSSGRFDNYRSFANENYWRLSKTETDAQNLEHWHRYYDDCELALNQHVKIEKIRAQPNISHNIRNGENWYYEDISNNIKLSYNNLIETDVSTKYPYYPSNYEKAINYGPMKIEDYLIDVVLAKMNITHLVFEPGWGIDPLNSERIDQALHTLIENNITVIYHTDQVSDENPLYLKISKVSLVDMKAFTKSMKEKIIPRKFLMWDIFHYRSWVYKLMLQLLLLKLES